MVEMLEPKSDAILNGDRPIQRPEEDALGYWPFSKAIGFAILAYQLNNARMEAEAARAVAEQTARDQTKRADDLQATLSEAGEALRKNDQARLSQLLEVAREQTQQIGAAAVAHEAQPAVEQIPLQQLEVRVWACSESPRINRTRAMSLLQMRPQDATRKWRRDYVTAQLNARASFRLVRNEIRYNPEEAAAADRLQRIILQQFNAEAAKVLTYYPSPNSISVFFCEGAEPPPPAAGPPEAAAR